ncbi:MAG: hypothetical protein ACR2GG_03585 [Gemmatimonadaceae bacterium]
MSSISSSQRRLVAALLAPFAPLALGAQRVVPLLPPRMEVGAAFEYAQPVSQFRQNVRRGFGGGGHFILGLDRARILGLRVDADFINYGNESQYFVLSSAFRRINVEQKTSNNIFVASVGPQISVPTGPIRPYVNGAIGLAYFYTQTSLKGTDPYTNEQVDLAQATNYSDNSLAYSGAAGVYVPLPIIAQSASLDIGARYNAIGRTRYLTKGDITNDPNNPNGIIITPRESDARFVTYHLGIAVKF